MENDSENKSENPQPPVDNRPPVDYTYYLQENSWSGAMYIKNSPLMLLVSKASLDKRLPNEVHRNMLKQALDRWSKSGSSYSYGDQPKKLARTNHQQVMAIVVRNRGLLPTILQPVMQPEDYELFERDLQVALYVSEELEAECERRAEEKRLKREAGNITWKTILPKQGAANGS